MPVAYLLQMLKLGGRRDRRVSGGGVGGSRLRRQRLTSPPSQCRAQVVLYFGLHEQFFKYLRYVFVLPRGSLHETVFPVDSDHRFGRRCVYL